MNQIDYAAEEFFATSCRDRMNQLEQRMFDHFRREADKRAARELQAFLRSEKRAKFFAKP